MRYDLHIHTKNSKCSNLSPSTILKTAKKKKLDGIAVTDHNSIRGGLQVSKLNKDRGFEVIIGSEIKTDKGEVLGYYLNRDIKASAFFEVIDEIHKQGGLAVIAHPFAFGITRKGFKLDFKKIKNRIDGVEGFNGRCLLNFKNRLAQEIAKKHDIAMTAGSDAHFWFEIGNCFTYFENNLRKELKSGKTKISGTTRYAFPGGIMTVAKRIKNVIYNTRLLYR